MVRARLGRRRRLPRPAGTEAALGGPPTRRCPGRRLKPRGRASCSKGLMGDRTWAPGPCFPDPRGPMAPGRGRPPCPSSPVQLRPLTCLRPAPRSRPDPGEEGRQSGWVPGMAARRPGWASALLTRGEGCCLWLRMPRAQKAPYQQPSSLRRPTHGTCHTGPPMTRHLNPVAGAAEQVGWATRSLPRIPPDQ